MLLDIIKNSPEQLKVGLEIGKQNHLPEGKFEKIILCGMGGSALAAKMIADYVKEDVEIDINQGYFLPSGFVTEDTLVLVCSYSGNTEETLACLQDARNKGFPVVTMSQGGQIEEVSKACDIPYYKIPSENHGRVSLGFGLGIFLGILEKIGVLQSQIGDVEQTIAFINSCYSDIEQRGKDLAAKIKGTVPIIYSGPGKSSLARVMKIHFNENAKTQSFSGEVPEMNHNEMVGFTNPIMKTTILLLRSQYDFERITTRMNAMKHILETDCDLPVIDVHLEGNSWLEETYYCLMLAYYVSYYLAQEYGVDPEPVPMVTKFKDLIK